MSVGLGRGDSPAKTGTLGGDTQGWLRIESRAIRSLGLSLKQERMRERQAEETWEGNEGSAPQMSSSVSKGMSPQTMSKRRTPRDHTVASLPK